MRQLKFIWVGKLKKGYWQEAEKHYQKQISHFFPIQEQLVKDSAKSDIKAKKIEEGQRIAAKIQDKDFIVCLDERGKCLTSPTLAQKLEKWTELPGKRPCFIIGGAFGLSPEIRQKADILLGLSPMTFTHEMARIILLEQIYRAATIINNRNYHH